MKNDKTDLTDCVISKDKAMLQFGRIADMLSKSYWAKNRPREIIKKSIDNSLCYGVYLNNVQVGFARVVTDYATVYYICDVIIDEAYRGAGLGKRLVSAIVEDGQLKPLLGILATKDADEFMRRRKPNT